MDWQKSITIPAELDQLEQLYPFIVSCGQQLEIGNDLLYDVQLVLIELVTNSIEHGYQDEDGEVQVTIGRDGSSLVCILRDWADPFDPTGAPQPDLDLPLNLRPIGGLGVHLVRQLMDEFNYQRDDSGGYNQVTLVKYGVFH